MINAQKQECRISVYLLKSFQSFILHLGILTVETRHGGGENHAWVRCYGAQDIFGGGGKLRGVIQPQARLRRGGGEKSRGVEPYRDLKNPTAVAEIGRVVDPKSPFLFGGGQKWLRLL